MDNSDFFPKKPKKAIPSITLRNESKLAPIVRRIPVVMPDDYMDHEEYGDLFIDMIESVAQIFLDLMHVHEENSRRAADTGDQQAATFIECITWISKETAKEVDYLYPNVVALLLHIPLKHKYILLNTDLIEKRVTLSDYPEASYRATLVSLAIAEVISIMARTQGMDVKATDSVNTVLVICKDEITAILALWAEWDEVEDVPFLEFMMSVSNKYLDT